MILMYLYPVNGALSTGSTDAFRQLPKEIVWSLHGSAVELRPHKCVFWHKHRGIQASSWSCVDILRWIFNIHTEHMMWQDLNLKWSLEAWTTYVSVCLFEQCRTLMNDFLHVHWILQGKSLTVPWNQLPLVDWCFVQCHMSASWTLQFHHFLCMFFPSGYLTSS